MTAVLVPLPPRRRRLAWQWLVDGIWNRVVYPPLFGMGGWVLGVTHLRFRMGMGTWVFTHLPVPRFGFWVWVLGISQHSEFVKNTSNWPFFERYEVIFYVFYYGTYSYVATTTYVRLPMSDPSDSSQFRVSGGWQWLAPIAFRRMGGYSTYPSTRQNMAPTHHLGSG